MLNLMLFLPQNCPFETDCSLKNWSCRYLSHLNSTIIKEFYADPEAAVEAVRTGHAWGALYFTDNFTDALLARMQLGKLSNWAYHVCFERNVCHMLILKLCCSIGQTADDETLDQSEIRVWLDMSNQQIGILLNRDIQLTYKAFAQDLLKECGQNEKLGDIPIQFRAPIYGTSTPSFTDFVAPGVILT